MGPHDGAVDHRVFVVGIGGQMLEYAASDARFGPTAEAPVYILPVAKRLRQVSPRDAGAITEQDGFDKQAVVRRCHSDATGAARQHVLDPVPLIIAQSEAAHRSAFNKADRL